ncbi:2-hydroxyacid dehydrogenase [Roseococcus sp. SYP-B2431]|uniref:2-hydroxyacid dehydrogenase n=1 Tax=Roseococcus sp. SYP-B2431 TaxID=2496640 RepID=UPI00103EEED7|nr:2-hydroxyacid dehydrogenase [Roseococcus sp. SYP-B2431]TCH97941.1 2-hydroxyacid dehydrogenase [Roseococcus sp. SYP-B2431]
MSIPLLVQIPLDPIRLARITEAGFEIHLAPTPEERAEMIPKLAPVLRAVLTNGATGLTAEAIAALPKLEIICCVGVGHENVDLRAAKARGIKVTNGPATNDVTVADHTWALILSVARNIPAADAAARRGEWMQSRGPRPLVSGKRLGILGLGNIGRQIAERGERGFGMQVAYHNRAPKPESPYAYMPSLKALAEWSDFLVIAAPGGAGTRHLVNAAILDALGPKGFLINIGRGSVVDTEALIAALAEDRIAGAAIDVVDGEPEVPPALAALRNIIITPHIGGRSPEAMMATASLVAANLTAHFAGEPVKTPVPMPAD